jgi:hypothetical protein
MHGQESGKGGERRSRSRSRSRRRRKICSYSMIRRQNYFIYQLTYQLTNKNV